MCRYAHYGPYKSHFACFECRKMFRRAYEEREHYEMRHGMTRSEAMSLPVPCPQCGRPMHNMGLDFKAPRQHETTQWEKVRLLFAHGYRWSSCGCGPGFTVATLKDVQPFLHEQARKQAERQRSEQQVRWNQQRQRVRKARREREREALQGVALSAQRDTPSR